MKKIFFFLVALLAITFAKPAIEIECREKTDGIYMFNYGFSKNLDSLYIEECMGMPPNMECYWMEPIYIFPNRKVDADLNWMPFADTTKIVYGSGTIYNCRVKHKKNKHKKK